MPAGLRRSGGEDFMIYAFGGYELDPQQYELRRGGIPVPLEPQVFDVLVYLMEHRDRVVTKEELLDGIWGTRFVTESTLTTRIKTARRAVGDDGRSQRIIRTVHGRGYRVVADVRVEAAPRTQGSPDAAPESAGPRPELAGRAEEMRRLRSVLGRVRLGTRRTVLISGEAGIGKTTLVEAFATEAADDARVIVGQCVAFHGPSEPFLPLLDALAQLAGEDPAVVTVLVERAPSWVVQLPWLVDDATLETARARTLGGTRERMLREIVEALDVLSFSRPLVLALEDLQWSDPSTLDVVATLARRRRPAKLLLLLTVRTGDRPTADDVFDAVHAELRLHHAVDELVLDPLPVHDLAAAVAARLGPVSPTVAAALHERSGGNPLYALSLAEDWRVHDVDPEHGPAPASVPSSLRELVDHRLAHLDAELVGLLEAAAVAGRRFQSRVVADLAGTDPDDAERRIAGLARSTSLVLADPADPVAFAFRHSLFRDAIYNRIPGGQRARLHHRAGRVLEQAYGPLATDHAAELALHFTRADAPADAIPHLLAAAAQAMGREAQVEALRHMDEALAMLASLEPGAARDRLELRVRTARGPALIASAGWAAPEVLENYERALALCRKFDVPAEELSAVLYSLGTVREYRGEYPDSQRLMEEGLRLQLEGTGPQVASHELLACSRYHQGAFRQAIEHATEGTRLYDRASHLTLMARFGENPAVACATWEALARWYLGQPDEAVGAMDAALTLARDVDHRFSLAHAHEQAAALAQLRRRPDLVEAHAQQALELSRQQGFAYRVATSSILLGWSLAIRGDPEGLDVLEEALAAYRLTGARMDLAYFLALHAEALHAAGRGGDSLAVLDEAVAARDPRGYCYDAELHRLRATILAEQGDTAAAAREFERAEAVASRQGARALQARISAAGRTPAATAGT